MKVPGQRSSFHICDILDLNTTTSDTKNNTETSDNNVISTDTSFPSQTSNTTSSRNDTNILSSTITSISTTQLPPPPLPPYQIASSLNNSMYSDLGHHYQSILPTVTRSWLKETEHYGM